MLKWYFGQSLHVRIAIIMLPFMAIGGWGLMDLWMNKDVPVKESRAAMQQLVAEGQCLLATNQCKLTYKDMKVSMMRTEGSAPGLVRIEMRVNLPIRGVKLALVHGDEEQYVVMDRPAGGEAWFGEFPEKLLQPHPTAVRIAIAQIGRVSYAEVPAQF